MTSRKKLSNYLVWNQDALALVVGVPIWAICVWIYQSYPSTVLLVIIAMDPPILALTALSYFKRTEQLRKRRDVFDRVYRK